MHSEDGDINDLFADTDTDEAYSLDIDEAPSCVLKRALPDTRSGSHTRCNQGEQQPSHVLGEQPGKTVGEQLGKAALDVPPRAEGERIGGSACGGHGLKQYC
eukprot:2997650-Rhodomonas_salina.2